MYFNRRNLIHIVLRKQVTKYDYGHPTSISATVWAAHFPDYQLTGNWAIHA